MLNATSRRLSTTEVPASATRSRATPELSIVVPAYQEEARIGATLDELAAFLRTVTVDGVEVIVVAATRPDGTTDDTPRIVEDKQDLFESLTLLSPGPKVGKGRDTRSGMLAARGRLRVFMDADLATPLHHLRTALDLARSGQRAVIGVRNLSTSHHGLRKLISNSGNHLVRALLLPGVSDSQCGFKMFTADVTEHVFSRQTIGGWGFDMEILAIARGLGCNVATIDIHDWEDVAGGTFRGAAISGALQTFQELLSIKWRVVTRFYRGAPPVAVPLPSPDWAGTRASVAWATAPLHRSETSARLDSAS